MWGCRIVWCILTSLYLVSLLPVSIIHVSDIFLVGFWSREISFIMWGCRGWGWQAAGTWVSVSVKWWDSPPPLGDLEPANLLPPRRSESPVCATDNKPSCVLQMLGWFIGSCGFSSLERRPEFWVLHILIGWLQVTRWGRGIPPFHGKPKPKSRPPASPSPGSPT